MKIRVVLYIDIIINIKFYLNSIFHKNIVCEYQLLL